MSSIISGIVPSIDVCVQGPPTSRKVTSGANSSNTHLDKVVSYLRSCESTLQKEVLKTTYFINPELNPPERRMESIKIT